MKKLMTFVVFGSLVASSAFAEVPKGDPKKAPLGEQCSIITNYVESTDQGGCGGGESHGDVQMTVTAALEGGKQYDIEVTVIDEQDQTELAYKNDQPIYYSNDKTLVLSDLLWAAPYAGDYQFNLVVKNHVTGNAVCQGQSVVRTK